MKSEIDYLNKKVLNDKEKHLTENSKDVGKNFEINDNEIVATNFVKKLAKKWNINLPELSYRLGKKVITKDDIFRYINGIRD